MKPAREKLFDICLVVATLWMMAASTPPAHAQTAAQPENLVEKLSGGADTAPDIDIPALRQQIAERIKTKADNTALRRPPIAPQLLKLPQSSFEIQFDPDTPIVRPASYRTIGRIADALTNPKLQPDMFLVVAHTESTGRREINVTLSQRRADAVRDILSSTFKVSPKRLRSVGLGEEQLQDALRPNAPANLRVQIIAIGEMPAASPAAPATASKGKEASPKAKNKKK
jgi:outer membrane protein OmpA-like peptidoglycan-associated protein